MTGPTVLPAHRRSRRAVQRVAAVAEGLAQPPGHYLAETHVATLASGPPLTLHTHLLRGNHPGPVVGIVSGLHGDEFSTAEVLLSLLHRIDADTLHGTLLLVPMASPLTFESGTRSTVLDAANLNRVFPGSPTGTLTEMLAHALCEQLLPACDALIDCHAEPDCMAIRCCYAYAPDDDYGRRSLELAQASGSPIIYTMRTLEGSLAEVARGRGIVAVLPETGGPLPGPEGLMAEAQGEILNLLRHLGLIPGAVIPPAQQVIVGRALHLRAPAGGLFRPQVGFGAVGGPIGPGLLLGTVASPYTGELLAEVRSPDAPGWLMMARGRTSRVHPGDPLYIVGLQPS